MKSRPIVFAGEMVRAILAGKKTQTRRVLPDPGSLTWTGGDVSPALLAHCPYGTPGDQLWVRETWSYFGGDEYLYQRDPSQVIYRADDRAEDLQRRWRPSIFMPRGASRITLAIAEVRVQRLQDISETDILSEGVDVPLAAKMTGTPWSDIPDLFAAWRMVWDHINGARRVRAPLELGDPGYMVDKPWTTTIDTSARWEANPYVWAISFHAVKP